MQQDEHEDAAQVSNKEKSSKLVLSTYKGVLSLMQTWADASATGGYHGTFCQGVCAWYLLEIVGSGRKFGLLMRRGVGGGVGADMGIPEDIKVFTWPLLIVCCLSFPQGHRRGGRLGVGVLL